MKKLGLIIIALGGLTLAYYLYEQYTIVKKFTYQITGVTVKSVSTTAINLLVGFSITNMSEFSAHITNVDLKAYINNVFSGTITNQLDIIIPQNGVGQVQVDLTILLAAVGTQIFSIISTITEGTKLDLDIIGTITIKTPLFPIKLPIKYSATGKDLVAMYKQNIG